MTSDSRRLRRLALPAVVVGLLGIAIIGNTAASLDQAARSGHAANLPAILIDEISSGAIWLMLMAVIVRIFRWASPHRLPWAAIPLVHAIAIPAVSLTHFVLTRALRVVIYATIGQSYLFSFTWPDFFSDLYKDVLNYLLFGLIWLGLERLLAGREKREIARPPAASAVLEVRDGAHTRYVPIAEILWAEAAGNYVELHMASGRPLLMRTTLAALAERLGAAGFVRIHRSRLVNPAAIQAIENLPAGDAVLRLSNGAAVSVSRTYRADISRELAARATTA